MEGGASSASSANSASSASASESATSSESASGSALSAVAPIATATTEGATTGGAASGVASGAAGEASDQGGSSEEAEVPWYRSPQMEGEAFDKFLEVSLASSASVASYHSSDFGFAKARLIPTIFLFATASCSTPANATPLIPPPHEYHAAHLPLVPRGCRGG